jgi:hypothetical protein
VPLRNHTLARAVAAIDKVPIIALLIGNAAVAGFVLVAHGGALAVAHSADPDKVREMLHIAMVSLPLSAIITLSSLAGLASTRWRGLILSGQALILGVGSLALFLWALSLLVGGLPQSRFAWAPGLMTAFCVYPVYVLRRTVFEKHTSASWLLYYSHLIALIIVLPVDVGVFARAISRML